MKKSFQTPWANISDMMAALMMVFLLISVVYGAQTKQQSLQLEERSQKISTIAEAYSDNRAQIYSPLDKKFSDRFEEWSAVLDKDTLTLRFNDPALLFEPGSSQLTQRFQEILSDFWVEYTEILELHSDQIREVRIEGHTSSEWSGSDSTTSYFNNMRLSQQRTRTTLEYCYYLTPVNKQEWVRTYVTANGMSFSRPVRDQSGQEDPTASRRVEFTIVVDSKSTLEEIGRTLNE